MNYRSTFLTGFALIIGLGIGLTGCARAPAQAAPALISVTVSYPVEQDVTDYEDSTGRTAAVESVEVRARVWGYLERVNFREGALVNAGDALFEIDPKAYQAQYDASKAKVAQSEASLKLAKANNQRYKTLFRENPGAVSAQDLDKYEAEEAQAVANLELARANLDLSRLNLEWTQVIAPVSGRVSRMLVTVGNLVQSGEQAGGTLLTTIVSVDPMYAYFDVDERTVLHVRQLIREGKQKSARDPNAVVPVFLGLANEEGYPHEGTLNFVENQVNPKTGTLRVRGVFPNPDDVLAPGLFVRVRVPIGEAHRALLVTERAIDNDQGQKILYVVNEKNEVVSRAIRLGSLHDGLRAIEDGVKSGERVIVSGLQLVRPGLTVEPTVVDMPKLSGQKSEIRSQRSEVSAMTGTE